MTKPLPFEPETFDLIFYPISNVYIEKVEPVFVEAFRILKKGGRLLSGLDNGINFIFDKDETTLTYSLPFNPLKNKEQKDFYIENDWGYQFSHTLTEQIGGQLKAGFILVDMFEDTNTEGPLTEHNVNTSVATLSEKSI